MADIKIDEIDTPIKKSKKFMFLFLNIIIILHCLYKEVSSID